MQKHLHKLFLLACMIGFLTISNPIFAAKFPENTQIIDKESMELIHNDVNVKDLDINPINTKAVQKSIVPDPKSEGKKVLSLFLKTMILSAICAFLIYIVLLFIRKFYASAFVPQEPQEFEELDLTTPDNKQEALKSFLNRTK